MDCCRKFGILGATRYVSVAGLGGTAVQFFFHFYAVFVKNYAKQESIPVGCVLPAFLIGGGGRPPCGETPLDRRPHPRTNNCEYITLPQTSFADSNNKLTLPHPGNPGSATVYRLSYK